MSPLFDFVETKSVVNVFYTRGKNISTETVKKALHNFNKDEKVDML